MRIDMPQSGEEGTRDLLEQALRLALDLPVTVAPHTPFRQTRTRTINRRGILWLGQTCNLRCKFCYYLDRIENGEHPQHAFMEIEKAKRICDVLVRTYRNTSVDIQGGEPTLFPGIFDLIHHCRAIGLAPTVITNGSRLADRSLVEEYRSAGLRDFIISVQGLGPVYDNLVQKHGAHERQMRALANLQAIGIPFRINCVLTRPVLPQLAAIAELGVRTRAFVVNFLAFNPFDDQGRNGYHSAGLLPSYDEIGPPLDEALDILTEAGVEANARYVPLCVVSTRHRKRIYTFHQLPYDLHENDFSSWSWTGLDAQRRKEGALSPVTQPGPALKLGFLRGPLRTLADAAGLRSLLSEFEIRIGTALARSAGAFRTQDMGRFYLTESRKRAREFCGYRHLDPCRLCDLCAICDGVPRKAGEMFGYSGLRPVRMDKPVRDPQYFIREQEKALHPEDEAWVDRCELP